MAEQRNDLRGSSLVDTFQSVSFVNLRQKLDRLVFGRVECWLLSFTADFRVIAVMGRQRPRAEQYNQSPLDRLDHIKKNN